jgi:flagellar motor switch/type III secretory pathway protein FliN
MSSEAKRVERTRFRGFESVPIPLVVRVGRFRVTFGALSRLAPGEVLPLDKEVGRPLDLMSGGHLLAGVQLVACDEGISLKLVADRGSDATSG